MARINFEDIKRRHAHSEPRVGFATEGPDGEAIWTFKGEDDETALFIANAHKDMGALIEEHERFTSNFNRALGFIDDFMAHHANVLPDEAADEMRLLQARMRGLL